MGRRRQYAAARRAVPANRKRVVAAASASVLFCEVSLRATGYLSEAQLEHRHQHLERQPERVLWLDRHGPREQRSRSVGFDDIILGEPLEDRQHGLVGVERVTAAL